MKKRILILTASIGSGHIKAAEAVAGEIRRQAPEVELITVDFMSRETSFLHWLMKKAYLMMLALVPNLYDLCYKFSGGESGGNVAQGAFAHVMLPVLRRLLERYQPDLALCTHPFPEGCCSILKKEMAKRGEKLPLAVVMTDYSLHQIWLCPEVDAYFMATEAMKQELGRRGISAPVMEAVGIPVDTGLDSLPDRKTLREKLGLLELPTVLLMGGGLGLGGLDDTLEELESLPDRLQLLVIAGRNDKLKARIQDRAADSHHVIKVWGYTDEAHLLMKVSDLLITKPGALTISEAFVLGLPMLLHDPIPGPETENAVYATRHGAAVWLHPGEHLAPAVAELLSGDLKAMGERGRACAHPGAAAEIAARVLKLLSEAR